VVCVLGVNVKVLVEGCLQGGFCEKRPGVAPCWTWAAPTEQPQDTREPITQTGADSGKMYLGKGKMPERGEKEGEEKEQTEKEGGNQRDTTLWWCNPHTPGNPRTSQNCILACTARIVS